jgi:hypothetical protein
MQQLKEFEIKKEAERRKKIEELRKSQEMQNTLTSLDENDKEFIAKEDDAEWRGQPFRQRRKVQTKSAAYSKGHHLRS